MRAFRATRTAVPFLLLTSATQFVRPCLAPFPSLMSSASVVRHPGTAAAPVTELEATRVRVDAANGRGTANDEEGGDAKQAVSGGRIMEQPPEEQLTERQRRKQQARMMKKERRLRRQGQAEMKTKRCDLCEKDVRMLIRCMIDQRKKWHMVCGKCWHKVSGGVVDGDSAHPHYRYGGIWKART